jgi:hypothetical protein
MADLAQGLRDFLFGAGPLKQAAAPPATPNTPQPAQPSGVDMQAEAAKAAKRSLPAPAPAAPVVKKQKPAGTAVKIGSQLMEQ